MNLQKVGIKIDSASCALKTVFYYLKYPAINKSKWFGAGGGFQIMMILSINWKIEKDRNGQTGRQWSARLNCPPEFCFASANFLTRSMKLQAAVKYCPAICQSTEERQHDFHEAGREMSVAGGTFQIKGLQCDCGTPCLPGPILT